MREAVQSYVIRDICIQRITLLRPEWTTTGGADAQQFLIHDSGADTHNRMLVLLLKMAAANCQEASILLIEPFYGGSHKQLIDLLLSEYGSNAKLYTLSAKKWHWRARTASLYLADVIPDIHSFRVLFTTSVLNMAELIALRPDLSQLYKILYFHENQLCYPVQNVKERDFQYGYNQILSSLVVDKVIFNSHYNQESFINGIKKHLTLLPDYRPSSEDKVNKIRKKSSVLYFPLQIPEKIDYNYKRVENSTEPLIILWPHRWEHDKAPQTFFEAIYKLKNEGIPFKLYILGESFTNIPLEFQTAKVELADHILKWGYLETKDDYIKSLIEADVVVSTSIHEFFGVSMLEAISYGCYPVCPNRLVYPEFIPRKILLSCS
ncbi:Glycosyltransferase-like domain-containing protein 1 [Nymphon striatum]|nr:Glycosyltransferase-like domain-containing protein 1 [Nymphon striatum]